MEEQHKKMEEEHKKVEDRDKYEPRQHQPPYISEMKPVTHEAYGGGLYGQDDEKEEAKNHEKEPQQQYNLPSASATQSADGIDEAKTTKPRQKQPASSGDRDIDVTGQSYIQ